VILTIRGKKALGAAKQLPGVKSYIGDIGAMLGFSLIKNAIVCVDDIERCGSNLKVRDVLGLVSNLKQRKRCKLILILTTRRSKRINRTSTGILRKLSIAP
jgi:hypothetical protein